MRSNTIVLVSVLALTLAGAYVAVARTADEDPKPAPAAEGWEYLIVQGGTTNLSSSGSSTLRKEPERSFREAFVIEQNLDKLGAKGWELVAVLGSPADPIYYLKRKK